MKTVEAQRQARLLLQARRDLLTRVCGDLELGYSPYARLRLAQDSLEQDECSPWRLQELQFVERIFGLLLGASRAEALERLQDLRR